MKKVSATKMAMIYAEAMYDSALQQNAEDVLYQDVSALKNATDDNAEDFIKLNNPLWKFSQKIEILEYLAQKTHMSEPMLNTLKTLAQNNNLNILPQVLNQFISLYNNKHNIAEVEVTTVIPLTNEQEKLLKTKLAAIFNKEIILRYIINPQIIGGLVLKYGTHFIDNSVKHKLDALEQLMKGTK